MRVLQPSLDDLDDDDLVELYAPSSARHVRVNFVQTLDAAIEVGGRSGSLGGPSDRRVFGLLRSLADVILVGAGTVRGENYGPAQIPAALGAGRARRGQLEAPPVAVVTVSADLDPTSRLFGGDGDPGSSRPVILTCAAAAPQRCAALAAVADVIICGESTVDLAVALDALAERGLGHVLCEGGPLLLNTLIRAELVDDLCLTLSPLLAGPGPKTLSAGMPLLTPVGLTLGHVLLGEDVLLTRYTVDRS